MKSDNCKDELNFARDLQKERLLVYLENVKLPLGMAMRLNRLQAELDNLEKNAEQNKARRLEAFLEGRDEPPFPGFPPPRDGNGPRGPHGPRDGNGPRGPRDGNGPRGPRGPRDGNGPRGPRGPRDGNGPMEPPPEAI